MHNPRSWAIICHSKWFNAEAYYAYMLAMALHRERVKVTVISQANSPLAERIKDSAVADAYHCDLLSSNPLKLIKALHELAGFLKRCAPDVITAHRPESLFMALLAKRLIGSKSCIVRFRGDPRPPRATALNRWLYGTLCDAVIVSGKALAHAMSDSLQLPLEKFPVVHAPVDCERFQPATNKAEIRRKFDLPLHNPLIGVVGRIGKVKGHEYFLQAFQMIRRTLPEVRAFIAYHEEHQGVVKLKEQVRTQGLDEHIRFIGFTPAIEQLVRCPDVAVISSIGSEANCRAAIEFMASGIPLVASSVGVIPEVVEHGSTGFIVPPATPQKTAEMVERLLTEPSLSQSFAQRARQVAEQRFSSEVFLKKVLAVIDEHCGTKSRTPAWG